MSPKYTMDEILWKSVLHLLGDFEDDLTDLSDFELFSMRFPMLSQEITSEGLENPLDYKKYIKLVDGIIYSKPTATSSYIASYMCDYVELSSEAFEELVLLADLRKGIKLTKEK